MNQIDPLSLPTGISRPNPLGQAFALHGAHLKAVAERGLGADLAGKVGGSDILQDTFCAASRDLADYHGRTPRELRNWLEGILRNRLKFVRRHFRKGAKRRVSLEMPIGHPGFAPFSRFDGEVPAPTTASPLSRVIRDERVASLRLALDGLTDLDRQVIHWHQRDRLSFEAVGVRLGISAEAARKRWARAILRLREAMEVADDPR